MTTKVKYELTRFIPQWKASLEGKPYHSDETVEVEVWEHQTRGLEPLAKAFAALKGYGPATIESGDVLFVRPPSIKKHRHFRSQDYHPMSLRLGLPTLDEDDDAQKVADEYFELVRQTYRQGCELAAKIVKTLLELPEEAWDSPHEITVRYADPIRVRGFSATQAFRAACRKLGLPEDYLRPEPVREAFRRHKKLCAHWDAIFERREAEREEARCVAKAQSEERKAEIEKVHAENRFKVAEMFLSTCDEADRERYERGLFPESEQRDKLRKLIFDHCDAWQYTHMSANYVCEECEDAEFHTISAGVRLNAKEFEQFKAIETVFKGEEFTLEIREHRGDCRCPCAETVREKTVLVTWMLPGTLGLSREYQLGLAQREDD